MNVFDIIGPVMIGPSSSHTAGAVRLGYIAHKVLGERAVKAEIELCGSFAQTYRGHGTDKALVAGILGMKSDDERIRNSLDIARQEGLEFNFRTVSIPGAHPNTARIILTGSRGLTPNCAAPPSAGAISWSPRSTVWKSPSPDSTLPLWCSTTTSRAPSPP